MSWETFWLLPTTTLDHAQIEKAVDALATAAGVQTEIFGLEVDEADDDERDDERGQAGDELGIRVHLPASREALRKIIAALEPEASAKMVDSRLESVDPPHHAAGYRVSVTIVAGDPDDEDPEWARGRLQLYSNDDDNRAACGVIEAFAWALARRLGAVHEDELERDPEQAMGWNSAAVLTRS